MREGSTLSASNTSGFKRKYSQAIVLFHPRYFCETFDEDARISSQELEIVLTSREMGRGYWVPMGGIPYHFPDN